MRLLYESVPRPQRRDPHRTASEYQVSINGASSTVNRVPCVRRIPTSAGIRISRFPSPILAMSAVRTATGEGKTKCPSGLQFCSA